MSRTILVTGSASGIGAATVARLRKRGNHVIGVDLRNAEIETDLATPEGRTKLVEAVARLAPDGLDGVIAGAGVVNPPNPALVIEVNFFGAVATLEGLRPLLARSQQPRAALIASSASILEVHAPMVEACLDGDEEKAKALAVEFSMLAYASSKRAVALWLRREAIKPQWAGAGITLNGVAPGGVKTQMLLPALETEEGREIIRQSIPLAVRDYAEPEVIAEVLDFLTGLEAGYLVGQLIFVDGGTDAIMRPESF